MMKQNRFLCLVLIYSILLTFVQTIPAQENRTPETVETKKGLQFRLREGEGKSVQTGTRENPRAEKLTAEETEAIFRRLPPMPVETADKTEFALRESSLPPPKTGKVIPVKFSPGERPVPPPSAATSAALEVMSATPRGFVSMVKDLSVTFSQPMVAVTSQAQVSETVPVRITPEIKGKWRWRGTNTLVFEAAPRFPMATKYTATIPAGTKSVTGAVLEKDFSWNLETPPVQVKSFLPKDETVGLDAVMLAEFNQQVDPAAVLPKISLISTTAQKVPLRLATQTEIEADKRIFEKVKKLPERSWIAFRAVAPMPLDAKMSVYFETGIPSAEGALTSVLPFSYLFETYGKFELAESDCGYQFNTDGCDNYDEFRIEFTNPIDAESFDKSLVKIEPAFDNAEIAVYGNQLHIGGCCKRNRETYKVTVSEKLRDVYGQTLGEKVSAKFKVGAPEPQITFEKNNSSFVTLDPNIRQPVMSVYSIGYPNLRVKIYAVKPEDYETFRQYKEDLANRYSFANLPPFGNPVSDKTIKIKGKRDIFGETKISLAPAIANGLGHAVLVVEPPVVTKENEDQRIVVWVEATQIGIDAFSDYEKLTVYASDLKTGKPLKNVSLQSSEGAQGVTLENGLGTIELPQRNSEKAGWMIARNGSDSAILFEENFYRSRRTWSREAALESLRWFVFDDRKIYRPGETVSVKGYLRRLSAGKITDIEELGGAARGLGYVLKDSRGNEILRGTAELNIFGAFDFRLKLPETLNLGEQKLELTADGSLKPRLFTHNFRVEEFRRPEFEVSAKNETAAPFYVGNSATVSVEAKYYAGGALANAATSWKVKATPTNYTPPNREDFTFGKFIPWWHSDGESESEQTTTENFKGATDAGGKHFLALDFTSANPARPFSVSAEARVEDVNRQTFAASTNLLVHPSELYVGIRTPKTFVGQGETFRVETITTDIDGRAVAGAAVSIVAELKDWEQIKGEWQETTVDTQTCEVRSENAPVACEFKPKQGGRFTIKASVSDKNARRNESEIQVWAAGGKSEPVLEVEKETVEMIPGKKTYAPGDVAEILVNAPFYPAEGVLTLRRNGVVRTERFTMNEASTILKIPVEEAFLPNFYAQVDLFGAARRVVFDDEKDNQLPKRPAFASGALNLEVATASRRLNVVAEPYEKTLEPGGETSVNVAVTDNNGRAAANAEVALVAVDESVLALTNYRVPDPVGEFYQPIEQGTNDFYSRGNILLASPDDLLDAKTRRDFGIGNGTGLGFGGGNGDGDGDGNNGFFSPSSRTDRLVNLEIITSLQRPPSKVKDEIRIRRNFDALAIFSPSVRTDSNGKATVKINLPDNLTRYRITAVAATNAKKFGKSESAITARQNLMVRPSAPRFMNLGDRAELPVVLQNQTDKPLTVNVAIRATNADFSDGNGRKVTIPANDRAELRFPVSAQSAGVARFQVGAVSDGFADAAEFAFPVWTPVAATESFATYGTTDSEDAIVYPVVAPENVYPQYGGLEITTSSTQLQELTDAFIYLQSYPFECSEQVSSRILSVAALRDVLHAFNAKDLPTKAEIEAKMAADIERLRTLQHPDGGFSFWSSKDESIPFVSVHVAHALGRAKAKGYDVPPALINNLQNYLRNIEAKYPTVYSPESRRAISAYALFVRDLLGDKDAAKARNLLQEAGIESLSAESSGWLLSVLAGDSDSSEQTEAISQNLRNRVTETSEAANFITKYTDGEYVLLASERRADGVILEALLKVEPNNRLIPKIVRGLLAGKVKGRWKNTQENAFVLLALDKYFQTYEKQTPDFTARIWFGKAFAGEQKFSGRSTDSKSLQVPMQYLQQSNVAQNLILDRQGAGRLYYRVGMKYALRDQKADAADFGFKLTRTYEAIDAPDDVRQNEDGSWAIKSGARIRVRLQMVAPTRRYHVALVDNLPAGFEIINSALATSESLPEDENLRTGGNFVGYYNQNWYDHQNLRDNRAEIFKTLLASGVWNYSYIARATTPGDFVVPPANAEEMYSPETFGRSRPDYVRIK
jgi:uncharacterized protein YfaS (alpha-2-macroglobulin family)